MIRILILSLVISFCHFTSVYSQEYDKVRIETRGENGSMKSVYESDDQEAIQKLVSCMKGRNAPNFKCGYTGKIVFVKKDKSEYEVEFNIKSCDHIVYMKGDRLISHYLKQENIELLKNLTKQ
ncbi:MAG: hypothetical protein KDC84_16190 [Crocinitomicaceae bacterium]|nr:hypothetical protein [Crocinitomicaceae bacterium]